MFDRKTTEFVPATLTFGVFSIISQWTLYAWLKGNYYLLVRPPIQTVREKGFANGKIRVFQMGNLPGLAMNVFTMALYFVYPPLTWR